jgi:hypothetical protein
MYHTVNKFHVLIYKICNLSHSRVVFDRYVTHNKPIFRNKDGRIVAVGDVDKEVREVSYMNCE